MARKKRILTEFEKSNIIAIISAGCSRETAARYAKCSAYKIRKEIAENPVFATEIAKAEEDSEVYFINKIRKAADKEQYWRAAAWVLERRCPNRYAPRRAGTLDMDQVRQLVSRLSDIVVQEIPVGSERRKILRRIHDLLLENQAEHKPAPPSVLEEE